MPVKVKICGITNATDALSAAENGADALGFIFHRPSSRYVSPEVVAQIAQQVPPYVMKVGVFVDAPEEFVTATLRACGLNLLQFHGNEAPEYCTQFGVMSMKAIRVSGPESLANCNAYLTEALLLDAYSPTQLGGTGETFNWDLALEARKCGRPIFLAGGLTPENVAQAVRKVRPFAVDVASGVEAAPGKKDPAKVKAFIDAAKSVSEI